MKKGLFLFVLFVCIAATSAMATSRTVTLKGSLHLVTITRSIVEPVEVYYSDEPDRILEFAIMVNNPINIKIIDSSNRIVYQIDLVNRKRDSIIVDMSEWADGLYQIVLTNPENNAQSTGAVVIGY